MTSRETGSSAKGGFPLCLLVSSPTGTQSIAVLTPGTTYTIGRSPASDIHIEDPAASEQHATIIGGNPPTIVDLGSEHGTWVGNRRLAPLVQSPIPINATIVIGKTVARFAQSRPSGTYRLDLPLAGRTHDGTAAVPSPGAGSPPPELPTEPASEAMKRVHSLAILVAASNVSVLIIGDTGVGKEVLARTIHERSARRNRPLVSLNCAAIPENLLESELYGYEKGAFSGAVASKPGLFETADGSTLFLDEVGDLPLASQAKLLRVLDTREVQRLGAVRPRRVDVRVISATNRDLPAAIAQGLFRSDLYYRLNGMTIAVPPLRERPEDIVQLSMVFAAELSGGQPPRLTPEAVARLQACPWHGNARELKSVIHRALLLAQGSVIDVTHLEFNAAPSIATKRRSRASEAPRFPDTEPPTAAVADRLRFELEERERRKIREALQQTGGSQKAAAALLGVSRRTLIKRLERLGMPRPRKHVAAKRATSKPPKADPKPHALGRPNSQKPPR